MRKDNLVHFIPSNYDMSAAISQTLLSQGRLLLKRLLETQNSVGEAVALTTGEHYVFLLIANETFEDQANLRDLESSIKSLKILMDHLGIVTCSISKNNEGLRQLQWSSIEQCLKTTFSNEGYTVTVCNSNQSWMGIRELQNFLIELGRTSTERGCTKILLISIEPVLVVRKTNS